MPTSRIRRENDQVSEDRSSANNQARAMKRISLMLSNDKTTVLMCNKNGCDASMTFLRGSCVRRPTSVVRRRIRVALFYNLHN